MPTGIREIGPVGRELVAATPPIGDIISPFVGVGMTYRRLIQYPIVPAVGGYNIGSVTRRVDGPPRPLYYDRIGSGVREWRWEREPRGPFAEPPNVFYPNRCQWSMTELTVRYNRIEPISRSGTIVLTFDRRFVTSGDAAENARYTFSIPGGTDVFLERVDLSAPGSQIKFDDGITVTSMNANWNVGENQQDFSVTIDWMLVPLVFLF